MMLMDQWTDSWTEYKPLVPVAGRGLKTSTTRCVCETLMPPKQSFFEKCNLDIRL